MYPFDAMSIIKKLQNGSPIYRCIHHGASVKIKIGEVYLITEQQLSKLKEVIQTLYLTANTYIFTCIVYVLCIIMVYYFKS